MDKFVYKSLRDNDKIKALKGIIGLLVAISIFMFVITFGMYISESNWDTVTTMPSLFQFETHSFAQTEIYEMITFYLAIVTLIISMILITILNSGLSCELTVYNEYVEGIAKFNKKIVIPLNQINAISVSDTLASISISTAANTYKFLFIKNNQDMCRVLRGDRSNIDLNNNYIDVNTEKNTTCIEQSYISAKTQPKTFQQKLNKAKKHISQNKKSIKIACICILTIAVVGVFTIACIKSILYSNATKLMNSENYQEAYNLFCKIPSFRDASKQLILIHDKLSVDKTIITEGDHIIAIKNNGNVVALGDDSYGECSVETWDDIIGISSNQCHSLGLKSNGSVVACGQNKNGECEVDDWTDIKKVSAGSSHSVGLRTDGTVIATGDNSEGQCNVSNWLDIMDVACGWKLTVGLKANGSVVIAGDVLEEYQEEIKSWKNIVEIAVDSQQIVALCADGTVLSKNCSVTGKEFYVNNWSDVISIATTYDYVVGVKADGTVLVDGKIDENLEVKIKQWADMEAVMVGKDTYAEYIVGVKKDGSIIYCDNGSIWLEDGLDAITTVEDLKVEK